MTETDDDTTTVLYAQQRAGATQQDIDFIADRLGDEYDVFEADGKTDAVKISRPGDPPTITDSDESEDDPDELLDYHTVRKRLAQQDHNTLRGIANNYDVDQSGAVTKSELIDRILAARDDVAPAPNA